MGVCDKTNFAKNHLHLWDFPLNCWNCICFREVFSQFWTERQNWTIKNTYVNSWVCRRVFLFFVPVLIKLWPLFSVGWSRPAIQLSSIFSHTVLLCSGKTVIWRHGLGYTSTKFCLNPMYSLKMCHCCRWKSSSSYNDFNLLKKFGATPA